MYLVYLFLIFACSVLAAQNRCRAGRYFDRMFIIKSIIEAIAANSSGMRGVINLPTPGFYIDTAVATEYFEPKDYVVLGGNWNGHAHVEMSPKPDYTYVKWYERV